MTRPSLATLSPAARRNLPIVAALGVASVWATWSVLRWMAYRWELDPTYSHGYLVPLMAGLILWLRRDTMPAAAERPRWWALGLFLAGLAMQIGGAFIFVTWLTGAALVAYLAGIAALVGGWPGLKWAAPGLGFLVFMIPLPFRLESLMRAPLQRISTTASAFLMQVLGLPAVTQGNMILLSDREGNTIDLGVIDACSGLKMLIVFFCLTTAFAILVKRPVGERLLILLSTLPIALACNIARITVTGVLYVTAGEKLANLVFHDLAGWLMMPMALILLWLELKLLSALFVDDAAVEGPAFRMSEVLKAAPRNPSPTG
jgi:exosortase